MLMAGSRGALLCIAVFLPICMLVYWREFCKYATKTIIIGILLSTVLIVIALMWDNIALLLSVYLNSVGAQSRTIEMFVNGEMTEANGRDIIYDTAVELIKEGGLFGHGVYGDRYEIGKRFYWGYAHNFFLEVFVCFGYLGGSIFIGWLIYNVGKMIARCKDACWKALLVIFLSSCVKLVFSDSFWYYKPFWALIGIFVIWKYLYIKKFKSKRVENNG